MQNSSEYETIELPKRPLELLRFMISPYKWPSFWFFFLSFVAVLAWTASPVIIADIVTRLGKDHTVTPTIWWLVAAFVALRQVDEILWRIAEWVIRGFKPQMIERVRTLLFATTLKKSYGYSVNSSSGQVAHWINQTRNMVNEIVDTTIWMLWGRAIGLIISAIFLFTVHWTVGLLFVVWLLTLFAYTMRRGRVFSKLIAMQSDEESKTSGIVVDALSNHMSVRIYNGRDHENNALRSQQLQIIRRWRDSWLQNIVTNIIKGQSAAIISGIALVLVLVLFSNGTVALGGVVLFVAYFSDASSTLWTIAASLDNYYRNFGTVQNALDGLNGEDARQGETVTKVDIPKKASITVNKLSFVYPDQPKELILNELSLDIPAGQKIGIVGHSGAGKSTLIGLLLGFYEPVQGSILINGTDISSKDPSFARAACSFVPQDTSLFNRTIKENLLYARPDASDQEIDEALKQAKAYDFVSKLPKGVKTLVGERGVKLSGGQRQRIAIARAILKDSPILLLDEATSALDSVSENAIQTALHKLMQKRTSIVIAHRLSTLKHLDSIIVLESGKIAEQGSHDELIEQGGVYADLWKRQKDGFIAE
jgi:ATP-binding cassette subfamily B protein